MNRPSKEKRIRAFNPDARRKTFKLHRTEMIQVTAALIAAGLLFFGWFTFRSGQVHRQAIDSRIEAWRSQYHLSAEQAARIRQIEEAYHGKGSIFTQPSLSLEQQVDHDASISRAMNPVDGARFLADQERIAKSRTKRIRAHAH